MSIADRIHVKSHYTRSVNLERDASSVALVEAYIPTSRALRTLTQFADAFAASEAPRSWSLVGPYGAGKSSFAAFLSHLLGDPNAESTQAALKVLRKADQGLARRFGRVSKDSKGHCVVLLTGSPEPLGRRLVAALASSAEDFWRGRSGPRPKVIGELQQLSEQDAVSTSDIVHVLERLQSKLADTGAAGLLIVLDELGKFLEYEARHYGANEIFLLQALAEHAVRAHQAPLSVIGLLHQSFDQYARGLGESLRNEWAKVQGRYENVPFIESAEQTLRVLAAAISNSLQSSEQEQVARKASSFAQALSKAAALPPGLDEETASGLFAQCYPLHPVSAILLPSLCQKVAQNERTLFSYLGSQEPHGLKDSIRRISNVSDWLLPWEIYEYFIMNQPVGLTDHATHRRWAEVVTAVERLGGADANEVNLLKTIGLLNIVGSQGGFKASKEIIELCLPTKKAAGDAAKLLCERSLIQYRKFNSEYRVWQGSDFDLDEAVEPELQKLGALAVAEHLNHRKPLLPIVARRYTIETGTLRYFEPAFADRDSLQGLVQAAAEPRIIIFLSESEDDQRWFAALSREHFSSRDLIVAYGNAPQLRESVAEVLALEAVRRNAQELNNDPVAQREFKDRYAAAVAIEGELLNAIIDEPTQSEWYWEGETRPLRRKRDLQKLLSDVLKAVYSGTPVIKNELINRDRISSQAAAGRNKLMEAMLQAEHEPDLGIAKFPPEKAIYRALLRETGLHVLRNEKWQFVQPSGRSSVVAAWRAIDEFLASSEAAPRTIAELYESLKQPPFGIREGVIPILFLAAYQVYRHELALYEGRAYVPYLGIEHLERLVKAPGDFSIQRFRIEGLRASIFERYEQALFENQKQRTVVDIARPLAKFITELPDFTARTKGPELSNTARAVRDAFQFSRSPEHLLFEDLPRALGYTEKDIKAGALQDFSKRLTDSLRELKYALPKLIDHQRELIAQAFNLDPTLELAQVKDILVGRYAGLEEYTVDVDGLRAFIKRLSNNTKEASQWLENVLMFLGHKPVAKWTDADRAEADVKLSDYSRRILDLETLRLHYDRRAKTAEGEFDVILLKTLKKGAEPIDEVVAIDPKRHAAAEAIKDGFRAALDGYEDRELQLAAVAEFVDEFLADYRARISKSKNELKKKRHHG